MNHCLSTDDENKSDTGSPMPSLLRFVLLAAVAFLPLSPLSAWTQDPSSASITACKGKDCVTINEPATVQIEELLKQADLVAVVKTLSGDTEHYQSTVYKAEVIQAFKGTAAGAKIFFGPFVGLKLGWSYLAFLRVSEKQVVAKKP